MWRGPDGMHQVAVKDFTDAVRSINHYGTQGWEAVAMTRQWPTVGSAGVTAEVLELAMKRPAP